MLRSTPLAGGGCQSKVESESCFFYDMRHLRSLERDHLNHEVEVEEKLN